jgi:diadenosine tetraphosphate (Ap4A) HIT family hydrolase
MSLTRDEWVQMWNAVERIENAVRRAIHPTSNDRKIALEEIQKVQEQIQSVIGQMR